MKVIQLIRDDGDIFVLTDTGHVFAGEYKAAESGETLTVFNWVEVLLPEACEETKANEHLN